MRGHRGAELVYIGQPEGVLDKTLTRGQFDPIGQHTVSDGIRLYQIGSSGIRWCHMVSDVGAQGVELVYLGQPGMVLDKTLTRGL